MRAVRKTMLGKYAITVFVLLMLIGVLLVSFATLPRPATWKEETVVFAGFKRERLGFHRFDSDVLVAQDGRLFSVPQLTEEMQQDLVVGESCTIIYSTGIGAKYIQALSTEDAVLVDLEDSITFWKNEWKNVVIIACGLLTAEIIGLILIDRLWCKKEHAKIKKLKEDIVRRKVRTSES